MLFKYKYKILCEKNVFKHKYSILYFENTQNTYFITLPETWCYGHFLCLFASSRLIALCIPQL